MKLTTALMVILSSFIYFRGARTEDEVVSYPYGSKIVNSGTETNSFASSMGHNPSSSTLPSLPEATDTFDSIRNEKKLFVDKSGFIKLFMKKGGLYVLTRPKRFGKSVFLQMVRRFLEGRGELFNDTEIAMRGNGLIEDGTWTPYPVIYIDFEDIPVIGTEATFRQDIQDELEKIAKSYELKIRPNLNVGKLIYDLKKNTGKPVSILVDNYDLPLMDDGLSHKLRKQVTSILAKFYGQIRANVDNVRLGLAIGISKLNILSNGHARFTDLTFDERFSSIMGFNSEEVGQRLRPYFECLDDGSKNPENETIPGFEETKKWYGGHQFVVRNEIMQTWNPASTCECLRRKEFGDFMGNAALVTIIKDKMMKSNVSMRFFEDFEMDVSQLKMFNLKEDEISLPLYMLCNGFLTIKHYNKEREVVSLGYPNDEIRKSLTQVLPPELVGEFAMKTYLIKEDVDNFVRLLNEFTFKHLSRSLNLPLTEFMATRQILPILNATGFVFTEGEILGAEVKKNKGDLDIHIKLPKSEFIIEMKYNKRTGAGDPILQLIEYIIGYEDEFRRRICVDNKIFLLGMNVIPLEKKENIVTSAQIDQWVLLPYKDGKIWMNECKTSSNITDKFVNYFRKRLKKNKKQYLTSPKIIW